MKKLFFLLTLTSICCITPVSAQTGVNIHIGEHGIDIRPDAFISYYQAPPDRTVWLQREKIPEAQWPLLFEIARAGNVTPDRVWEIRRQQSSWYDVLNALKVPPSYFYYEVPAEQRLSPPYGRAYGYYRSHPTESVRWSDGDLVRLASVKYISDSTHRPVHEAVVIYEKQPQFIHTHDVVNAKQKHGQGHDKHKKDRGHHKKHGHDRE